MTFTDSRISRVTGTNSSRKRCARKETEKLAKLEKTGKGKRRKKREGQVLDLLRRRSVM
jgi:hypothetical protein